MLILTATVFAMDQKRQPMAAVLLDLMPSHLTQQVLKTPMVMECLTACLEHQPASLHL